MPEITHGRSHPDDQDRREPPADPLGVIVTASGAYPLHADGTFSEQGRVTVQTVIYDRLATPSRAYLEVRLEACREYAAERGWNVAAEHVDTGDAALRDLSRPGLDAALADVRKAADEPTTGRAVLLVHNHGRLSHDAMNLASWRYRVDMAGGETTTVEQADEITPGILDARTPHRAKGARP